jgi:hypothetical protein
VFGFDHTLAGHFPIVFGPSLAFLRRFKEIRDKQLSVDILYVELDRFLVRMSRFPGPMNRLSAKSAKT